MLVKMFENSVNYTTYSLLVPDKQVQVIALYIE